MSLLMTKGDDDGSAVGICREIYVWGCMCGGVLCVQGVCVGGVVCTGSVCGVCCVYRECVCLYQYPLTLALLSALVQLDLQYAQRVIDCLNLSEVVK